MVFEVAGQRWKLDNFVNFGAEGQTYLATQESTGKQCVAKFCSKPESSEIALLAKLPRQLAEHPNFISYEMMVKDVWDHFHPAHHIIFMENVPNGELFELLASQEPGVAGTPVGEGTMRRFL